MTILILAVCALLGVGAYQLICSRIGVPTAKASKTMLNSPRQGKPKDRIFDVYVNKIAHRLERFVKLDPLKKSSLDAALKIAEISYSPEVYLLRAYITAGAVALCAVPCCAIHPFISLVVLGLAVTVWFGKYYGAFDYVKKWRKRIEAEIPRFALTLCQSLKLDRDVLKALTGYRKIAGKEFGSELDKAIAEMRTGHYETALMQFENRIGSTMLSDIVRGLIGILRGDDQQLYFQMLSFDMRQIEQNRLKKEAARRPKKIQKYSMMMLFCILIIYAVVLVTEIVGSLGVFL